MRSGVLGVVCWAAVAVFSVFLITCGQSFSEITLSDVAAMTLSAEPINSSDNAMNWIPTGTILMYRTDEGRYGVMEIAVYGQDLTLNWRTYNATGSVHSSGNGLAVHASYSCDLDRGVEGAFSADFQWHLVTGIERYLEPSNGAAFAVYQPSTTVFTPVVPVSPINPPAPVSWTGQASCFQSADPFLACCICEVGGYPCEIAHCPAGQDGNSRRGTPWPIPRFRDNDDGTVTDNLTGLIWLRDARCFPDMPWEDALHLASTLQDGMCGLGDGSAKGDWRLPNVREMQSLIRYGADVFTLFTGGHTIAVPDTSGTGVYRSWGPLGAFINLSAHFFWTSTSYVDGGLPIDMHYLTYGSPTYRTLYRYTGGMRDPDNCTAWIVDTQDGSVFGADEGKEEDWGVWPVRSEITPRLPRTGQSLCYESASHLGTCGVLPTTCGDPSVPAGQDGDLQTGVAWPVPRFTDNYDGTVTDNLTGLIWLKDANSFGERTWGEALDLANRLRSGTFGLSDASVEGDWRLPNVRELQSLIHYGVNDPAVPDTIGTGKCQPGDPFINLRSWFYWTSTTYEEYRAGAARRFSHAWCVNMFDGHLAHGVDGYDPDLFTKSHRFLVWPVRGGV